MKTNVETHPIIGTDCRMKDDTIRTTEEFWKLIESMIDEGGMGRVASCSVSEVMRRKDAEPRPHKHVVYKIHLYNGI